MWRRLKRCLCLIILKCRRNRTVFAFSIMLATSSVAGLPVASGGGGHVTLNFPNDSRSFDATRRAVRFWGYDSAMEASFFVTEDALRRIEPGMACDQTGALRVFDVNRPLIYAAAAKVYARGHRPMTS